MYIFTLSHLLTSATILRSAVNQAEKIKRMKYDGFSDRFISKPVALQDNRHIWWRSQRPPSANWTSHHRLRDDFSAQDTVRWNIPGEEERIIYIFHSSAVKFLDTIYTFFFLL